MKNEIEEKNIQKMNYNFTIILKTYKDYKNQEKMFAAGKIYAGNEIE